MKPTRKMDGDFEPRQKLPKQWMRGEGACPRTLAEWRRMQAVNRRKEMS